MSWSWQIVGVSATLVWGVVAGVWLWPHLRRATGALREQMHRAPLRCLLGLAAVGAWVAYGGSKPAPTTYAIRYSNAPTEEFTQQCEAGRVYALPSPEREEGRVFCGWACSNGKRYDDGMLVFNLAEPGETVTMTAIWVEK